LGQRHDEIEYLCSKHFLLLIILLGLRISIVDGQVVIDTVDFLVIDHKVGENLLLLGVVEHFLNEALEVLCQVFVFSERSFDLIQVLLRVC
jgi:hypothetical protein